MSTCARHHNNHNTTHSKQTTRFFGLLHRTRFLGGKCTHQTGYALSEAGFIWSGRNKQKKECGSWETATERPDTFTQGSSLVTLAQWLWEEALRDAAKSGVSDMEAGRFKVFGSKDSLRKHLKNVTNKTPAAA